PTSGAVLRETYVSYVMDCGVIPDDPDEVFDHNAMMNSTVTYLDDNSCGPDYNLQCYAATNYYGRDGAGHFRQSSTAANFPGAANYRTSFTNYNPGFSLTGEPCPSAPNVTDWVLNTSTEQCTIDETTAPRTSAVANCAALSGALTAKTQFESTTGFLTARRTL